MYFRKKQVGSIICTNADIRYTLNLSNGNIKFVSITRRPLLSEVLAEK